MLHPLRKPSCKYSWVRFGLWGRTRFLFLCPNHTSQTFCLVPSQLLCLLLCFIQTLATSGQCFHLSSSGPNLLGLILPATCLPSCTPISPLMYNGLQYHISPKRTADHVLNGRPFFSTPPFGYHTKTSMYDWFMLADQMLISSFVLPTDIWLSFFLTLYLFWPVPPTYVQLFSDSFQMFLLLKSSSELVSITFRMSLSYFEIIHLPI